MVPRGRLDRARQVAELYITDALDRVEAEEAGPGAVRLSCGFPAS